MVLLSSVKNPMNVINNKRSVCKFEISSKNPKIKLDKLYIIQMFLEKIENII